MSTATGRARAVVGPRLPQAHAAIGVLFLVGVAAVVPRLLLAHSTLPYIEHPDEPGNVVVGTSMLERGALTPGRYNYPSLLSDVVAVVARCYEAVAGPLDQRLVISSQNGAVSRTAYPDLVLGLRWVSVLASVLLCLVVVLVVQQVTRRSLPALGAGLLMAVSPLTIENGVLITPDVYAGLGCAVVLLGALALLRRPGRTARLLAGAAAGLAAGAKYNAGLVLLAVVAACLLTEGRQWSSLRSLRRLLAVAGAAAVSFVVVTPGVLVEPGRVLEGIRFEMAHYATGQPGFEGDTPQFYVGTLVHGDLPLVVLVLAGLVAAAVGRRRREVAVVLAFAGPYAVLITAQNAHFARNLLPLVPALGLLAGFGLDAGLGRLGSLRASARSARPSRAWPIAGGVAAGVVGVAVVLDVAANVSSLHDHLDQPSRQLAREWLYAHVPPGSRVEVEVYGPYLDGYDLARVPFVIDDRTPRNARAYVLSERGGGRYTENPDRYPVEAERYRQFQSGYCEAAFFAKGPWIRILEPCRT